MKSVNSEIKALGFTAVQKKGGVSEFRLDSNGLKVLLAESHVAPVVTTMIVYRVGSRNEGVGFTGSTHFLEHMMFKGTKERNPKDGNGFDDIMKPIGALNNATTFYDRTNYFEVVPKDKLGLTLAVEADRMRNLVLTEEDRNSEMTVVRNEFERGENNPGQVMFKLLMATAYQEHPYHHPVIGWRSDVEGVPMERMREFYDTFYWPNNATVILSGDFDTLEALALIAEHFGKIPASPHPIPQVYTVEPGQEGQRRFEIHRPSLDPVNVSIAFRSPGADHEDIHALAMAADVLGHSGNSNSRLYKALIESGKAVSVSSYSLQLRDPSIFMVEADCAPGVSAEEVEAILVAEVEKLKSEPPTVEELAIAVKAKSKSEKLKRDDSMRVANMLMDGEAVADWTWSVDYAERFAAVTADDVAAVARRYFNRKSSTVGVFLPEDPAAGSNDEADGAEGKSGTGSSPETAEKSFASRIKRFVLDNGLTVLAMATPGSGTVSVSGSIRAGDFCAQPGGHLLPTLASDLITYGAKGWTQEEIARALKGMSTNLRFSARLFDVNFGSTVVVDDIGDYMALLSALLTSPVFPQKGLDTLKPMYISHFKSLNSQTEEVASAALSRALYPEDSYLWEAPFDAMAAEIPGFTTEMMHAYHRDNFSPARTIITIVGDIDADNALDLVPQELKDWSGVEAKLIVPPVFTMPEKASRLNVPMPGKANVDIVIGVPADVQRLSDDYQSFSIANAALGNDTISARLGKVVRVKHGLTYGIYSRLGNSQISGSPWKITVSVNPENVDRALELIREVMVDYHTNGITERELADEKSRVYGQFVVGLRNTMGIASAIAGREALGLPMESMDTIESDYASVTKDEVDAAIKRHMQVDRAVTVVAGSF